MSVIALLVQLLFTAVTFVVVISAVVGAWRLDETPNWVLAMIRQEMWGQIRPGSVEKVAVVAEEVSDTSNTEVSEEEPVPVGWFKALVFWGACALIAYEGLRGGGWYSQAIAWLGQYTKESAVIWEATWHPFGVIWVHPYVTLQAAAIDLLLMVILVLASVPYSVFEWSFVGNGVRGLFRVLSFIFGGFATLVWRVILFFFWLSTWPVSMFMWFPETGIDMYSARQARLAEEAKEANRIALAEEAERVRAVVAQALNEMLAEALGQALSQQEATIKIQALEAIMGEKGYDAVKQHVRQYASTPAFKVYVQNALPTHVSDS